MQDKAWLAKCLSVDDESTANRPCRRVSVLEPTSQPACQYSPPGRCNSTFSPYDPLKKCRPGGSAPLRHAAELTASS
jgi:hypothetical protein